MRQVYIGNRVHDNEAIRPLSIRETDDGKLWYKFHQFENTPATGWIAVTRPWDWDELKDWAKEAEAESLQETMP